MIERQHYRATGVRGTEVWNSREGMKCGVPLHRVQKLEPYHDYYCAVVEVKHKYDHQELGKSRCCKKIMQPAQGGEHFHIQAHGHDAM